MLSFWITIWFYHFATFHLRHCHFAWNLSFWITIWFYHFATFHLRHCHFAWNLSFWITMWFYHFATFHLRYCHFAWNLLSCCQPWYRRLVPRTLSFCARCTVSYIILSFCMRSTAFDTVILNNYYVILHPICYHIAQFYERILIKFSISTTPGASGFLNAIILINYSQNTTVTAENSITVIFKIWTVVEGFLWRRFDRVPEFLAALHALGATKFLTLGTMCR